jgi:Zn-dependent protease
MSSARTILSPNFKRSHRGKIDSRIFASSSLAFGPRRYLLPSLLFVATILTTTLIGMRYMYDFRMGQSPITSEVDILPYAWDWQHLRLFTDGLPFSMTLLAILLAHEFGHFLACRYFNVETTLPLLFPAPTFSGTFGALIRIRSRVRSRGALIAIGASGPIAGFVVASAATCYGLVHSTALNPQAPPSILRTSAPGLMTVLRNTLIASYPDIPPLLGMAPHPVLIASWVGLLITAFNLLPAGQLDGGHIVYALSPRLHRLSSTATIGVLLYLGTIEWIGWLFWAILLMLPMMKHPKILDRTPLGLETLALAPVSFAIFAVSASTQPVAGMSLMQLLLKIHWGLGIM